MKKALTKSDASGIYHFVKNKKVFGLPPANSGLTGKISGLYGDISGLTGEISSDLIGEISSGLYGNISGLYGEISSGLTGNISDCEISESERAAGIDVADLVLPEANHA